MSYSEIIVRCETDPLFFLGCVCWAAFAVSFFAVIGWRFGKAVYQLIAGR